MPKVGDRFNPHRMFDGVFIPEAICQYRGISPGAKLAYGRFCRFAGKAGEVFPSMATIGKEIGCSHTQARSYVNELIEEKFVECEGEPGKSNTYYFLWHAAFDGEVGFVRFAPPLKDAGGVPEVDTPQGCWRPPLKDAGGVPLKDAGDERESLKESHVRESFTPLIPTSQENQNPQTLEASEWQGSPGLEDENTFRRDDRRRYPQRRQRPRKERHKGLLARIQDMQASGEMPNLGDSRPAIESPPPAAPSDTPDSPTVREMRNFAQWWNDLVPEKPVDPRLFTNPHAFRDELFRERFEEICNKARSMIQAGADVSLGRLIAKDTKTGLYGFAAMLSGDWDWMTKTRTRQKPLSAVEQVLAGLEKERDRQRT